MNDNDHNIIKYIKRYNSHQNMKKSIFTALFFIQFLSSLWSASPDPIFGEKGMVVSTSKQASQAGIEILKKGGNAIDAAVAVGFALAVTSSGNGNLGGGEFQVQ